MTIKGLMWSHEIVVGNPALQQYQGYSSTQLDKWYLFQVVPLIFWLKPFGTK